MITKEEVDKAQQQAQAAHTVIQGYHILADAYARQECPLKKGDTVEIRGNFRQGNMMLVNRIDMPGMPYLDGYWCAHGYVLNEEGGNTYMHCRMTQKEYEGLIP